MVQFGRLGYEKLLAQFRDICSIDLNLSRATVKSYCWRMKAFFDFHGEGPISREDIRSFLKFLKEKYALSNYSNYLKALKVFFRDFMDAGELVKTFRFPNVPLQFNWVPSKREVREFYYALSDIRVCNLYLLYAVSGLRTSEGLSLLKPNVNFKLRMIVPRDHETENTKLTYVTFYNEEMAESLEEYLSKRSDDNPKLFRISNKTFKKEWQKAKKQTCLKITPKVLRKWFCNEMGELGVTDRYIDAFCGRVPRSILARHYTDYSPQRLKRIYDKARLKVLT